MKKYFLLSIFLLIFFIGLGHSQSITVTSPRSGDTWYKGSSYTITWNCRGSMNANVKIRLYQGNRKVLNIVNSTPNNGSFSWQIPANIAPGEYKIRVKTVDNQVFDDSDTFAISIPKITVTNPRRGVVWHKGESRLIKWEKEGNMHANVKIRLYQGDRKILGITNSTPNNRQYSWRIPGDLPEGIYRIRVKTVDNKVYDDSDDFRIERGNTLRLTVKYPNGGERLFLGILYKMKWDTGGIPGNVRVELYRGGNYYGTLYSSISNSGNANLRGYEVVNNGRRVKVEDGDDYKIKIISLTHPNVNDFSDGNFSFKSLVLFHFPPSKKIITVHTGGKITFMWKIRPNNIQGLNGVMDFRIEKISPSSEIILTRKFYLTTPSFTWKIPNDLGEGYYRAFIYIWAIGGGVSVESNKFYIKKRWKK